LTGGFPCQDISVAGKGEGIEGERSGLWSDYWRAISILRPRFAIIENVGAITFRGLDQLLGSLAKIGYDAEWQDIRAEDVGAPHRRERIWIIAYPSDLGCQQRESIRREVSEKTWRTKFGVGSEAQNEKISNAKINRMERLRTGRKQEPQAYDRKELSLCGCESYKEFWSTEPDVGRLATRVSNRVDRLKGLGNAIVPQIACLLFNQIKHLL
jgi:DNA (cytosine-5)-methyltransferase 1